MISKVPYFAILGTVLKCRLQCRFNDFNQCSTVKLNTTKFYFNALGNFGHDQSPVSRNVYH